MIDQCWGKFFSDSAHGIVNSVSNDMRIYVVHMYELMFSLIQSYSAIVLSLIHLFMSPMSDM